MSGWSRIANVFRSREVEGDIEEELQSHFDEAQAAGRDPGVVSRAFGSRVRMHEAAREALIASWLDSLIADVIFGSRQIRKHKTVAAAVVLSLGLGIGSCMAAFRMINALFLRPLPVAHPERLYAIGYEDLFEGRISSNDGFEYAVVPLLREAVKDQAKLLVTTSPGSIDLTFGPDGQTERVWRQYVSGSMFGAFGLHPALGRLLGEEDDTTPGANPYAVISYEYWSRRFAKDSHVLGRRFRTANGTLQIVGVASEGFTGTDPGTFTDIFVPNMMNTPNIVANSGGSTFSGYHIWLLPAPGASIFRMREELRAALHSYREEQVKSWPAVRLKQEKDFFVAAPVSLKSAAAGRPAAQGGYRRPLAIFAVLVGLVLLIACANAANLTAAQAAARRHEIALRISIGAARARLVQLVLVESAIIATAAAALGVVFSWQAAPFIVDRLNPPAQRVRLALHTDWRVTVFAVALTFAVMVLFGLAPALRASSISPAIALRGDDGRRGRRHSRHSLTAAQAAFCTLVLFVAGLFIATFERMANQPTGFSSARVLTLEASSSTDLPAETWYQVTQRLNSLPGVESAALAQYALMSFNAQTGYVWANGHSPDGSWTNSTWFLGVSPGWLKTMKLPLLDGRDFRWNDDYPKVAVVNEKFARKYFGTASPVGRNFETLSGGGFARSPGRNAHVSMEIIGVVPDARYEDMRLPVPATAYVPFRALGSRTGAGDRATFVVRSRAADPISLAPMLRVEIRKSQPGIRVANIATQQELVDSQMVRERLLAALSVFFAAVALILAGVGIYGVLNYAVLERRRELGIRMALGAGASDIARQVTCGVLAAIALGSTAGLVFGLAAENYITSLLYQVKIHEPALLVLPPITMICAALLAAAPAVLRAVRVDPSVPLRAE
ncbi:MAG TPA: ADOP family duplicated permease [Bryobacteraceae bacterium]|nr:ADOP family duplicated permease [Bryobacteraceae bacterium]